MFRRLSISLGLAAVSLACAATVATAANEQPLAGQPVTLIVPFSPGGGTDILARTVAPSLSERLGTSVVVENKPGAAGSIAAQYTARSAADGHTLMVGSTSEIGINPSLYAKLPYDVDNDFEAVAALAYTPMVLVVDPSSPVKTAQDLVELARKQPGSVNYASAGVGSGAHLAAELFMYETGIEMTHVPYKGVGQAFSDVIGAAKGMFLFTSLPSSMALASSGKVRVIAVASRERSPLMPDVPTFVEAGIPGYVMEYWYGIVAPKGLPDDVRTAIHTAANAALREDKVKDTLSKQGLVPFDLSTQEFADFVKEDMERWAKVVKSAGLKIEG